MPLLRRLPVPIPKGLGAHHAQSILASLAELVVVLPTRITVVKRKRLPVTEAHITCLNGAAVLCKQGIYVVQSISGCDAVG